MENLKKSVSEQREEKQKKYALWLCLCEIIKSLKLIYNTNNEFVGTGEIALLVELWSTTDKTLVPISSTQRAKKIGAHL